MSETLQLTKTWLEILSALTALLLGIPFGLYQYYRVKRKEQMDREYGTYNALDEKFLNYQEFCLNHPKLDVFDVPDSKPATLSDEEQKQELVAFTMLFAIFERAFLMYCDHTTAIKERQWTGWHAYIRSFCTRDNFRRAWGESGATFDSQFEEYMVDLMR